MLPIVFFFINVLILNLLLNNWKIQHSPFMPSQAQPKRCATHCYIARNIYLNQQLEKLNPFWSAGAGSDSLRGAKLNNPNAMPSTENIIHGNPLQGSFPHLNRHSGRDKGQAVASFPHPAQKDKCSEGVNFMDPAQDKQLVLQQAPQLLPAGNLLVCSFLRRLNVILALNVISCILFILVCSLCMILESY